MNVSRLLLAVPLLTALPATANEAPHANLYYIPDATLDVSIPGFGSGDDDGDGFGANLYLPVGVTQNIVVTGEYQTTEYDDSEIDTDQWRIGAGWQAPAQTLTWGAFAQFVNLEFEDSEADGFGVQGRLSAPVSDRFRLYGQIGYLMLEDDQEDLDGVEYLFGAAVDVTPQFGAFIDYRLTDLEGEESEAEIEFADLRIGARLLFGGI